MTVYFISRHPGALAWAREQRLAIDEVLMHLDGALIGAGDTVIGTLPVGRAAEVCAAGASFISLSLELPSSARGRELSATELRRYGARLERYHILRVGEDA